MTRVRAEAAQKAAARVRRKSQAMAPVTILPLDPAASAKCVHVDSGGAELSSSGWQVSTVERNAFKILAFDKNGEAKSTGGDRFVVKLRGPTPFRPDITDEGDGTYRIEFVCSVSGKFELVVLLNGEPVQGTPVTIEAHVPKADATKSKVALHAPNKMSLRAGEACEFDLMLFDPLGKPAPAQVR